MTPPPSSPRAPRIENEMTVAYEAGGGFLTAPAVNLSRGGLFINTQRPLAVGTSVRLLLSLPGADAPVDLGARVARVSESQASASPGPGMAIEFVDVDDEKRSRIDGFVENLRQTLQDGGAPRK